MDNTTDVNIIVERLLRLVDLAIKRCENGPAFAHLSVLLEIAPEIKDSIKQKYITSLCNYGKELENNHSYSEIFKCYENALKLFPNNEVLFNNLGSHLIRLGYSEEGRYFVMKALNINKLYLPALTNIQILHSHSIERWHYRMLNDSKRNLAYKRAICDRLSQGYRTVLDIGCGSLILSLYAAEYTVNKIYACDYSQIMSKIALEVLTQNKMENVIKLFNMNSNDLNIPDHIDERVSLVVTETMDAGLFGEHILVSLKHAWDKLLLPPKSKVKPELPHGCVIPHSATVYAVPIQCSYIRKKNIYYGKDEIYFNSLNLCSVTNEPYDCEKLNKLPGGYVFLAEPQEILCINFNDPCQIDSLLNSQNLNIKSINYSITQSGSVDAIASWFVVNLTEDISINTICNENDCCWEQALFISKSVKRVNVGDELCVQYKWQDDHYILKLENEINKTTFIPVERDIISFLNDKNLVEGYIKAAKQWYLKNKPHVNVKILDVCPFPIFGLEILSLASDDNCNNVEIYYTDENLNEVFEKLKKTFDYYSSIRYFDKENCEKFDIINVNHINFYGEFNTSSMENLKYTEKMLKPNGILLPENILIKCQLVNSKWLPFVSKVIENDSCNSYIRDLMNTYSVNHHLDVFKNVVTNICLSNCETSLILSSKQLSQEISSNTSIQIITSGLLNAILYYFEVHIYDSCMISTGNEDSYVNQCAFLVENVVKVSLGDIVKVNTIFNNGHLFLSIDES